MCGIAGIIDFRGRSVDRAALNRFSELLRERGPDDHGVWVHEQSGFSIGLVNTRLAVRDLSPAGHQPMTDSTGRYALVYNGELYDRNITDLSSEPLRGDSDTEIVLRACIREGPEVLT